MSKRRIAVMFWYALVMGFLAGAQAFAKPADLPGNPHVECDEGDDAPKRKLTIEFGLSPNGITLRVEAAKIEPEAAPAIDALLPAFVEHWLQHMGDLLTQPERSVELNRLLSRLPFVGAAQAPMATNAEKDVQGLYDLAEFYRRAGGYRSARFFYQRVHLRAPTSELGQRAIDRIQDMEERLRESEEQNLPRRDQPDDSERDVRNGTMPLGLVNVTY